MANPAGFDPQGAAIEPRAAEPALPEQALLFEYLEKLFHRARTEPNFPNWSPELLHDRRSPEGPLAEQAPIAASVLIPLIGQAPSVLLTRRTSGLSSHAGQISFPGGRAESFDQSEDKTALREAHEEIGLLPDRVRLLGRLPNYITASGFCVTPVIGWVAEPAVFTPDQREVEELFRVPLSFVMNPANHQVRAVTADQSPTGKRIRFYAMPYFSPEHDGREFFIWGATAAMLRNLYHFLYAAWHQQSQSLEHPQRR